jgi:lipid-A-disaccharide synthase
MMLIAGEASGDTLGAELVHAFQRIAASQFPKQGNWNFFGAGGRKMQSAGVDIDFDLTEHAVVGVWEVLKNYPKFKKFFDRLLHLALVEKPDVIVLIDYPGFNLRFAKTLRQIANRTANKVWNPKIVYYVSPQIWAWHESRVHQIARDIDLLLSIFPFEKRWYAERVPSFKVEFVGHPLVDRFKEKDLTQPRPKEGKPNLVVLPGSRVRELNKHLPVICNALALLKPDLDFTATLVVPNGGLEKLARQLLTFPMEIQVGNLAEALQKADAAIASSGTVTMECAFFQVPTVVIYKTSWSTYQLGKRFIKVSHIAMPNLLAGKSIFPELIQNRASPAGIHAEIRKLLCDQNIRNTIQTQLVEVRKALGPSGASERAAEAILKMTAR